MMLLTDGNHFLGVHHWFIRFSHFKRHSHLHKRLLGVLCRCSCCCQICIRVVRVGCGRCDGWVCRSCVVDFFDFFFFAFMSFVCFVDNEWGPCVMDFCLLF